MNEWIKHVKEVQHKHGISYKEALKIASKSYKKGKGIEMNPELYNKIYNQPARYTKSPFPTLYSANPMMKGGKIKGKGFNWNNVLHVVDKIGNTSGNLVSSALGKEMGGIPLPNPYSWGRQAGENLGYAIKKQI